MAAQRKAREIKTPKGFASTEVFLGDMRAKFQDDFSYDEQNRLEAVSDAKFVAGEQWDDTMRARRIAAKKPIIVVNRLVAYIAQLIGNRRLNQTSIKVIPDVGGTREAAKIREGIIRNIEKQSRADRAYDKALQNAAIGGIGNFGLSLEYANDDVFDQNVVINALPNPLAVVWDRFMQEPTGADAEHAFEVVTMSRKAFDMQYPGKTATEFGMDTAFMQEMRTQGWVTLEDVRVVSYWRMVKEERELAMLNSGAVIDITDRDLAEVLPDIKEDQFGAPMIRKKMRPFAEMYVCSATDILDGPYRLPISRVPLFRVPGYEIDISDRVDRFGIVRFAKDPQRMHNYWRSVIVERLMLAPKQVWVASDEAVEGREEMWSKSHETDDTLLIYNATAALPPQRTPPAQIEPALIQEAGMTAQDMRDVTNMHEASMGQVSNEVSGKAIRARQAVGELGTVIYTDNLNNAIEECGRVINELIPFVFPEERQVKILGEDMREKIVKINGKDGIDITLGKYGVTVITGPTYATQRMEASDSMLNMTNAMPETMGVAADLIVQNQDWPGAEQIAKRLRRNVDPSLLDMNDLDDEERQFLQSNADSAKQKSAIENQMLQLQMAEQQAKTNEANARAAEAEARARATLAGIDQKDLELMLKNRGLDIQEFKEGGAIINAILQSEIAATAAANNPKTPTGA